MARIRSLKPQFFTSLTMAELGVHTRLTFAGLWTHSDDEGRCLNEPRLIKAAIWPLDDEVTAADVERYVSELAKRDLVQLYRNGDRHYLQVTNWHEHQSINKARHSDLPGPDDDGSVPDERNPPVALPEPSRQEGNKEQGVRSKEQLSVGEDADGGIVPDFEDFWQAYPRHHENGQIAGGGAKKPALARWNRLRPDEKRACMVAVAHYRADCERRGSPVKHPEGWLNERRWENWQQPARPPTPMARGKPPVSVHDEEMEANRDNADYWLGKGA